MLLAIYSRISLAVFRLRFKHFHLFVKGVCSSLHYSIYKVQGRSRLAANFFSLTHLVEFVKIFFKIFQILFCVGCAPGFSPFITQLLYVNTSNLICQGLFPRFLKFFVFSAVSRRQLAYTTIRSPICQALFNKFRHLFL